MEFIDEELIFSLLNDNSISDLCFQRESLQKARIADGLSLMESAPLIQRHDKQNRKNMCSHCSYGIRRICGRLASGNNKLKAEKLIADELSKLDGNIKNKTEKMINRIKNGERGVYS